MASLDAVEEKLGQLVDEVAALDPTDDQRILATFAEVRRVLARWEPQTLSQWNQVEFAPLAVPALVQRSGHLAQARGLLLALYNDVRARPRSGGQSVVGTARSVLQAMIAVARMKPPSAHVLFQPSSFLDDGVSTMEAIGGLDLLRRRGLVKQSGSDHFEITDAVRDIIDGLQAIDDHLPIGLYDVTTPPDPPPQARGVSMQISIFISHSAQDADLASSLTEFIEGSLEVPPDAIRCTSVDGYKPNAGTNAINVLRADLRGSKVVVALLTPASSSSSFVLLELGAAWALEKACFPILAGPLPFSALPGPFKDIQTMRSTDQAGIANLRGEVARATGFKQRNEAKAQRALQNFSDAARLFDLKHANVPAADAAARSLLDTLKAGSALLLKLPGLVRDLYEFIPRLTSDEVTTFVSLVRVGESFAARSDELRLRWGEGPQGKCVTQFGTVKVNDSKVDINEETPLELGDTSRIIQLLEDCRIAHRPLKGGVTTISGLGGMAARWAEPVVISSSHFLALAELVSRS